MSAPFAGPPALPFDTAGKPLNRQRPRPSIHDELRALARPRKHYQWYYSTREANEDMWHCPQGVHDFLRAYYHHKSADWKQNQPVPLKSWTADGIGQAADATTSWTSDKGMAETVAPEMPSAAEIAGCRWLPDEELRVYSTEYERTGFQGGLQWYRCATGGRYVSELQLFSGRTIDVPSMFIAGKSDWGVYQKPGDFEKMQNNCLHADARLPPARGRGALGAAGAARSGGSAVGELPEEAQVVPMNPDDAQVATAIPHCPKTATFARSSRGNPSRPATAFRQRSRFSDGLQWVEK